MMSPTNFNDVVESVYNLPLEERLELQNLLEHNIAESRRDEILLSYKEAKEEHKTDKLKFSSNTDELMNLL